MTIEKSVLNTQAIALTLLIKIDKCEKSQNTVNTNSWSQYVQAIWQRATKHISIIIQRDNPIYDSHNATVDFSVWPLKRTIQLNARYLVLTTWCCTFLNHRINEFGELNRLKTASNHRHRNRIMSLFAL